MKDRHLCIHGHFYQPPRESPWLEAIELQDSAHPFHDWNERVSAECYRPNAAARILDDAGRIVRIVENYSRISFNFGPTLLSWMEKREPALYASILEADRRSRERFSGHGSALAQAHSHLILPLANRRDKWTQILWGKRDFQYRFGRDPEGMWLPETAVDLESLELLAEAGIRFTILAPHQARRVRDLTRPEDEPATDEGWERVDGDIDPSMPYLCRLPSGGEIALFFYDGPISQAVAFEGLLVNGRRFAERLASGFDAAREGAQLMHIATDGETYGHHHRHGEMALAYALHLVESEGLAQLTNYGEFLERFPPTREVEIREDTSWSCIHGIERWRSDCGCHTGGQEDWSQAWRAPLREALDWLRDVLAEGYEIAAGQLLADPWRARDDFVEVVLDRSSANVDRFFDRQLRDREAADLDSEERRRLLELLELQRHAMYMTTSCGWFFNELSGIETVQVLRYAARAVQLAQRQLGLADLEERFLARLEQAHSNLPEMGSGRDIYRRQAQALRLDLDEIAAHYAVSSLFEDYDDEDELFCFRVNRRRSFQRSTGRAALALGVVEIESQITEERSELSYGVLHFGDHNIIGGVREFLGGRAFEELASDAEEAFERVDFAAVVRLFDRIFPELTFSLASLFRDEQRKVVAQLLAGTLEEIQSEYRKIYNVHAPLMRFIAQLDSPLPAPFLATARSVVELDLLQALSSPEEEQERIRDLMSQAAALHLDLDRESLSMSLDGAIERLAVELAARPSDLDRLGELVEAVRLSRQVPLEPPLWETGNLYYRLAKQEYPARRDRLERLEGREEREAVESGRRDLELWLERFERLGALLGFRLAHVREPEAGGRPVTEVG